MGHSLMLALLAPFLKILQWAELKDNHWIMAHSLVLVPQTHCMKLEK